MNSGELFSPSTINEDNVHMRPSESYHPQSRYRGVHWENGKWRAAVYYKGKTFRAGRHYYEEDAANAVNRKCEELGIPPRALCYNAKPREKKKKITKYHPEEKVRAKNASKKKIEPTTPTIPLIPSKVTVPIASPATPLSLRRPRRKRKKKVDETAVDLADLDAFLEEAEKVPVADKPVFEENRYLNYNEEDVPECDFAVSFKKQELEENHWTLELEKKAMSLYEARHSFMAISYFCKLSVNKVRSKIEALTCEDVPKRQPARLRAQGNTPAKRKIGRPRKRKREEDEDEETQIPKSKPKLQKDGYNELLENPFVQCRISPTLSDPVQQENPFEPVEFGVPWTPEPAMHAKPQINEFYDGVFFA